MEKDYGRKAIDVEVTNREISLVADYFEGKRNRLRGLQEKLIF